MRRVLIRLLDEMARFLDRLCDFVAARTAACSGPVARQTASNCAGISPGE